LRGEGGGLKGGVGRMDSHTTEKTVNTDSDKRKGKG